MFTNFLSAALLIALASAQNPPAPKNQEVPVNTIDPGQVKLPPKEKLTPVEARLDAPLRNLMRAAKSGGQKATDEVASNQAIPLNQGKVSIKIAARTEKDLAALKRRLTRLGGTVTTTFQANLYGAVPVQNLEALAKDAKIVHMSADLPMAQPLVPVTPAVQNPSAVPSKK